MQQYQVPQFIDVEDKVFGPLTIKQFIYILGGVGLIVILWILGLPSIIFWPLAMAVGSFFFALAFWKVNGQPFVVVVNNAANHILHSRLYVWKRIEKKLEHKAALAKSGELYAPRLSQNKLKDLSWSLDINSKVIR